jgi:molecular chaperone DnaJ
LRSVNYYDILEVDAEADAQQIKAAFRQKAKQLHPDVNKAPGAPFASTAVAF